MTRWTLVWLVSGCAVTVQGKSTTTGTNPGTDPTDPGGTTDPGEVTGDDDDDDDTVVDPANCDGTYDGVYDGADHGTFNAEVVESEGRVYVAGISSSVLDGILDIAADRSVYGENNGYWMEGNIDDDCILDGNWGVVKLPGVAAGAWSTAP